MTRKTFLTVVSATALLVGLLALLAPGVLLEQVKSAAPSEAANAMARTVGILLVTIAVLNFLVRDHADSPTLKAVLVANLLLQLGILPIDPMAYANGTYPSVGAFLPNTLLHVVLAAGFAYHLRRASRGTVGLSAGG